MLYCWEASSWILPVACRMLALTAGSQLKEGDECCSASCAQQSSMQHCQQVEHSRCAPQMLAVCRTHSPQPGFRNYLLAITGPAAGACSMALRDVDREEHEDQLGLLVDSRDAVAVDEASQDSQRSTLFTVCPFILGAAATFAR